MKSDYKNSPIFLHIVPNKRLFGIYQKLILTKNKHTFSFEYF